MHGLRGNVYFDAADALGLAQCAFDGVLAVLVGTFFRPFSIRMAQDAQVMPSRSSIARLSVSAAA